MPLTPSVVVVDNFYNNVDQVRAFALSLPFGVKGNYPGLRTESLPEADRLNSRRHFEELLGRKIDYWPGSHNTAFQYTLHDASSWIHHDDTEWAAVLYLTPNAPVEAGTTLYRHRESGISQWDRSRPETDYNHLPAHTTDLSKWEPIHVIGNVYNRLVIYRGRITTAARLRDLAIRWQMGGCFRPSSLVRESVIHSSSVSLASRAFSRDSGLGIMSLKASGDGCGTNVLA